MIPNQDPTIWIKQNVPRQRKKKKKTDTRETRRFRSKIWKQKDHNKKAEWINNMETEL